MSERVTGYIDIRELTTTSVFVLDNGRWEWKLWLRERAPNGRGVKADPADPSKPLEHLFMGTESTEDEAHRAVAKCLRVQARL